MTIKQILKLALTVFLVILAASVVFLCIHSHIFNLSTLSYHFFDQIIIMALLCGILCFILYSPNHTDTGPSLRRLGIHALLNATLVILLALCWKWILPKASHIILLILYVFFTYVLIHVIIYAGNKKLADQMNDKIRKNKGTE